MIFTDVRRTAECSFFVVVDGTAINVADQMFAVSPRRVLVAVGAPVDFVCNSLRSPTQLSSAFWERDARKKEGANCANLLGGYLAATSLAQTLALPHAIHSAAVVCCLRLMLVNSWLTLVTGGIGI